jgi:serine/threonine-protein kinase
MDVISAGAILAGRYRLDAPLGTGATATVWRAHDEMYDRTVAVKLVKSPGAADPMDASERLRREARAAARLDHPNVTYVFDYGETSLRDGVTQPFLVMELLEGESLEQRLGRGPLPWREAVDVCAQVADGLDAAHAAGIVHRDVKPANVFLARDAVKVLDFGIAATAWDPSMTRTGQVVGTPWYLAPERLVGKPAGPTSDVYSLGCVLHHALMGTPPFEGDNFATIAVAHTRGTAAPLRVPDMPDEIIGIRDACLSKNPMGRPMAAVVGRRLREVVASQDRAARTRTVITQRPSALPEASFNGSPRSYQAPVPADVTITDLPLPRRAMREQAERDRGRSRLWLVPLVVGVAVVLALGVWSLTGGAHRAVPANGASAPAVVAAGGNTATATTAPTVSAATAVQRLRALVAADSQDGFLDESDTTTFTHDVNRIATDAATPGEAATARSEVDLMRRQISTRETEGTLSRTTGQTLLDRLAAVDAALKPAGIGGQGGGPGN